MQHRKRLSGIGATVALTIGLLVAAGTMPAAAAGGVTAVTGYAYGYRAFGISLFGGAQPDTGPAPTEQLASDASNTPHSGAAPTGIVTYGPATLLTSDAISLQSTGSLGSSGSVTSTSSVSDINKATTQPASTGSEELTADAMSSTCTAPTTGSPAGSTSITNGTLATVSGSADPNPPTIVNLPANPPANDSINGQIDLSTTDTETFTYVFNEQGTDANGNFFVNAVDEYFHGPTAKGNLIIGQVVCGTSTAMVRTPAITAVSPTSGSGSRATPLTVTGTNLQYVTSATVGGSATHAVTHDLINPSTTLYVASPGTTNSAGATVDVTVTNAGGTSATSSADHFTFNPWGYLRVTTPSGGLPSQVSADGNFLDTWATTWVHMDTGSHQVCFSDVQGWTTPACSTVSVTQGATTTLNSAFTQRGFLQVQESPAGVDGTVSVDGNQMDDYGMYTDLPTGSHQVCFSAAVNYNPPACQMVSVTAGATTQVTGTYTSNPGGSGQSGTGFLRVTTNPPLASQISVDGIPRDTWGFNWLQLPAGAQTHNVCFRSVQGYTTPACSTVTITAGQTTTVPGNFVQNGFLQVQESPAGQDGVVSVDGIARDDYGMFTDIPTGPHTVCWGAVTGKTTPACQNVWVSAGATTMITGTYS